MERLLRIWMWHLQTIINTQTLHHTTHFIAKNVSLTATLWALIESVLIMASLIRRNKLEHWLHERGYSKRVAKQERLKARKIPRNELLEKERNNQEKNKLKFNKTYYPAFQNTKTILEELPIILTPDKEY